MKPKDWQKIEVKQGKTETINDIVTTVNYLDLMFLNNLEGVFFYFYEL
ncbi:hypothetical protein [Francisella philomiragia]|nr:hypothetical protein [Francisella philomiragia]MBY7735050.1 hypothetical protein [Francisella philomiragia]